MAGSASFATQHRTRHPGFNDRPALVRQQVVPTCESQTSQKRRPRFDGRDSAETLERARRRYKIIAGEHEDETFRDAQRNRHAAAAGRNTRRGLMRRLRSSRLRRRDARSCGSTVCIDTGTAAPSSRKESPMKAMRRTPAGGRGARSRSRCPQEFKETAPAAVRLSSAVAAAHCSGETPCSARAGHAGRTRRHKSSPSPENAMTKPVTMANPRAAARRGFPTVQKLLRRPPRTGSLRKTSRQRRAFRKETVVTSRWRRRRPG